MTDDAVQLRQFVENGDEAAFGELVGRHFGLVYGAALRITNRDASLAEDVAQTVFADLARKAGFFPHDIVLTGWLYQAARFAAAKAVRSEQRRRTREQEALTMRELAPEPSPEWERLGPLLDAAMGKLNPKDRDAILLHYFEQESFRRIGAGLNLSDDAAQKRVSRALDKLRTILTQGGITLSGSSLSTFLSAAPAIAVPAGLASSVAKISLARAAALGAPNWTVALACRLASAKARLLVASILALLLGSGLAYLVCGGHSIDWGAFTMVDLSGHYNGGLDKSWTPDYGNNDLAALGEGRHALKGVPFETHGIVQLQGAEWKRRGYNFPESVEGIAIGALGKKIHLLHANSAMADPLGRKVAGLILHYADGEQATFDIRQGVEVLDWWEWPRAPEKRIIGTNTVVAWRGSNPPAEHQGARIRLFDTAFVNPHPEKEIRTIDYDSAMADSAPFMVALTIER